GRDSAGGGARAPRALWGAPPNFVAQNTVPGFRLSWTFHALRDDDLRGQLFVARSNVVVAAAVVEFADHGLLAAVGYAQDAAFRAPIVPGRAQLYQDFVAMHGAAAGWRRDKEVALD